MPFVIFNDTNKDVTVEVKREYERVDKIVVPASKNVMVTNDAGLFAACQELGLVPKVVEPVQPVEKAQVKKAEVAE